MNVPVLINFLPLSAFAIVVAIIAIAYYRFTQPGEVLAGWARLVYWVRNRYLLYMGAKYIAVDQGQKAMYTEDVWLRRSELWLKPILTCEKCIAGQMALWLFLWLLPFDLLSLLYVIGLASYMATWGLNRLNS